MRVATLLMAVCILGTPDLARAGDDVAVTLSGSRASMLRQNRIAKEEAYTFLRTPAQVLRYVDDGALVPLDGSDDYRVIAGYPWARPVVRSFIERLSADYRGACEEPLVVTSLTRPATRQPRNASPLSVHPAGMAVDLRFPANLTCRAWLKEELLALEERGVIDATLEMNPPHFHVAVFPAPWMEYDAALQAEEDFAEATRLLEEAIAEREAAGHAFVPTVVAMELPRLNPIVRLATWVARLVGRPAV